MDRNQDRRFDRENNQNFNRRARPTDYRAYENFGNDRRGSDRNQAEYHRFEERGARESDREARYGRERRDERGSYDQPSGNDQHDWNRNIDDGSRDTQRDDRQAQSFAYTDNYEEGPHFHEGWDTPRTHYSQERRNDFRPLTGSFTHPVDQRRDRDDGRGFREIDRDANRELNFRKGRDFPRTSNVYGSRANDMSRGVSPYGYGLGDSNYHETYYGRDREEFSRGLRNGQENHEGMWETVKDTVKNFFGHGPKGYKRSDDRIHEDVCEVLARHPGIDASEIEVRVKDGHVHLSGEVDSRFTKRRAEEVIDHISGVHDVRNELTVRRADVEGGRARFGSGTGTSLGATSPLHNQSGASLLNQSEAGSETAYGSSGTAGTSGSAVNAGTRDGDGTAKRERDLHNGIH